MEVGCEEGGRGMGPSTCEVFRSLRSPETPRAHKAPQVRVAEVARGEPSVGRRTARACPLKVFPYSCKWDFLKKDGNVPS